MSKILLNSAIAKQWLFEGVDCTSWAIPVELSNICSFQAKKGLGAQKVNTDFKKVEEDAKKAFELRENPSKFADKPLTAEESVQYIQNINMAYKDLSQEVKEQEKKMKNLDFQKAQQLERLGMGVRNSSSRSGISHSGLGDMMIIEECSPSSKGSSSMDRFDNQKDLDRKLMSMDLGSDSGAFGRKTDPDDHWETLDFGMKSTSRPSVIDTVPSLEVDHRKPNRKVESFSSSNTDEAQKKFGAAKAISSAQFFGNDSSSPDFEERTRLNRFQGASSLSSDEYFGRNVNNTSSSAGYSMGGTNLYDIKEGVREGVTKVAGRLSNLASDVMTSIQDKYGS